MLPVILLILASVESQLNAQKSCLIFSLVGSRSAETCELAIGNESLMIVPISSSKEFDTVVEFVSVTTGKSERSDCSEVIGIVGDLDHKTASIIHTLTSRADLNVTLVSAVAPSTFLPTTHLDLPNLLHMNPLTHYVEALDAFLDHLNWTRIGLISDDTPYYELATELVQQKLLDNPKTRIIPFVRISERDNRTKVVQTFKNHATDVIVVLTAAELACSIVQEARHAGLLWPEYAWILLNVNSSIMWHMCEEGVIFLQEKTLEFSGNYHARCSNKEIDMFLNSASFLPSIIYHQAHSGFISDATVYLASFNRGRRQRVMSVMQMGSSGSRQEIAVYDSRLQHLTVAESFIAESNEKPRGTILRIRYSDHNVKLHTTLVALLYSCLVTFTTIILTLYLYFRKEPEIRATSVTVSLSMFLGCYILITYLPVRVSAVETSSDFRCNLLVWLSLGGIPFTLITATMFAKMLRVYLIFSDPLSYKKTFFRDPYLFLYIVLLVSPSPFILIVWANSDPFRSLEINSTQDNVILINRRCISHHTIGWLGALLGYIFILSFALTCLAIKTTKIRYKHFRDTKSTNAFVFLSSLIMFLTLVYWYFFYELGIDTATALVSDSVLYIGHSTIAIICQTLLFVPKVYPPLKRRIFKSKTSIAASAGSSSSFQRHLIKTKEDL